MCEGAGKKVMSLIGLRSNEELILGRWDSYQDSNWIQYSSPYSIVRAANNTMAL